MTSGDSESVAEKVKQGTYFSEARSWYSQLYHFPIVERSFLIVIIFLGALTALLSAQAFFSIFPLVPGIPFVVISQDSMEELPRMQSLRQSREEDYNVALLRYFLTDYIERREGYVYDPAILQRNFSNIRSVSTPELFAAYRSWYDASNVSSPFNLYGTQGRRAIAVTQVQMFNGRVQAVFTETVTGLGPMKTQSWVAEIGYTYTPLTVQQDIEELSLSNFFGMALDVYQHPEKYYKQEPFTITPMRFMVTSYSANPYITQ